MWASYAVVNNGQRSAGRTCDNWSKYHADGAARALAQGRRTIIALAEAATDVDGRDAERAGAVRGHVHSFGRALCSDFQDAKIKA